MKYIIVILLSFTINNLFSSDWRLVAELDNYSYLIRSDVESISCPDSNNCFALVNSPSTSVLYKSIDQGKTWNLIYEDNKTQNPSVEDGVSPNQNYYFIADYYYSKIEKSTDGGLTFKTIVLDDTWFGPNWTLQEIAMYDTNYGYARNHFNHFITKNGWESFETYPKKVDMDWGVYFSPIFMDSLSVVMTYVANLRWNDSKGYAFVKYHLNENKWDTLFFFERDSNIYCDYIEHIYFVNDTLGFACGGRGDIALDDGDWWDIIYKTTDGGNNWKVIHKELKYPERGFYNNISFTDEMNGIAVGNLGKIAMTNDGGETWVYESTPNAMSDCRKMLVTWAGRTPLIGTWDAGIFRYEGDFFKFTPDTTYVEEEPEENQRFKSLVTVSPNPASEYIEISNFNLTINRKVDEFLDIKIYNVFGEKMFVEVQNFKPLRIDISNFPNGIYFISVGNEYGKFVKYR